MKKLFIAAVLAVALGTSAFAGDANKLSYRVKNNFELNFEGAKNVNWTVRESFVKASFILAGEQVEAFFSTEGELIGTARKVQYDALPVKALKKIESKHPEAKVLESIEYDHEGDRNYFVSLEDKGKKHILQVSLTGTVTVFKGR